MKIVKFKDGTYGVRKGCWFFGYSFASDNAFWHHKTDAIYTYCRFRTIEDARKVYTMLTLSHEVVE